MTLKEQAVRRMAYKTRGALVMRGVDVREYFPEASRYSNEDEEFLTGFATQGPLIHNGRKMKR